MKATFLLLLDHRIMELLMNPSIFDHHHLHDISTSNQSLFNTTSLSLCEKESTCGIHIPPHWIRVRLIQVPNEEQGTGISVDQTYSVLIINPCPS